MTIRELINILIDAPDKDKRVSVEYKQREIDSINNGYEWNEVEVTNAVIGGAGAILEAHPFTGERS